VTEVPASPSETAADREPLRRTLVLVSAIVCFETLLFTVLAPLLPHLADRFGLSKSAAGALVACYAAGAMLAALPSGLVAARLGAKQTALLGLVLLGASSVVFGLAPGVASVFAARVAQGAASSFAWTGGFAWLLVHTPDERRGEAIGTALGAAVAGALLGPAVGSAASAAGMTVVFVALAVPAFALALWGAAIPGAPRQDVFTLDAVRRALVQPSLLRASLLTALAGFLLGVISVLAPLHLAHLGWSATGIGAIFLLEAAANTAASPVLGRWADRAGRRAPIELALVLSMLGSLGLLWSTGHWPYAALVLAAGIAYGLLWTPALVLISDAALERGLGYVVGFALMNLAWSPGQMLGSVFAGGVAQVSSDALPYAVAGALCVVGLASVRRTAL
jgi:MFS family permease